jgi:hypothetical protein
VAVCESMTAFVALRLHSRHFLIPAEDLMGSGRCFVLQSHKILANQLGCLRVGHCPKPPSTASKGHVTFRQPSFLTGFGILLVGIIIMPIL